MPDNQTLQIISFLLAVLIGVVAFGLVKRTGDEFDRYYEGDELRLNLLRKYPTGLVVSLLVAFALVLR